MGAESTGKTTLVRALSAERGWPWVAEAARKHVEAVGRPLSRFDVAPIAARHLAAVRTAPDTPVLLLDTDLLATLAYAEHYHATSPGWLRSAASRGLADLYLVCKPDFAFDPEPVQRGSAQDRLRIQARMEALLAEFDACVVELSGPLEERLATALAAIDDLLQKSAT
ncbi:MAG: ATP-binding protein [Rhodothermales bacterium]|nr:ATP-binding protein [Rhodothermales bacterium]MBO6781313.1 ATP-binding protein [Rhodothermales bacterium]